MSRLNYYLDTCCWEEGRSHEYIGTQSYTAKGRICQFWSSQTPHAHAFNNDSFFPLDGSLSRANNYCRDPDQSGQPWCYTLHPTERREKCNTPKCNGKLLINP